MGLAIGFGGKFYTLWDIRVDTSYYTIMTADGEKSFPSSENHSCTYIKNVSFDIVKVKEIYPNLEICEDLKGKNGNFDFIKLPILPAIFINKGKNRGTVISQCNDLETLYFSYHNEKEVERLNNIENRLIELGAVYFEDRWYDTQSEVDVIIENVDKYKKVTDFYKDFQNGGDIEVVLDRNLGRNGSISIENINYKFSEYKEMYYNGYNYALPSINGKGKKVKGKTLKLNVVSSYDEYDECWSMNVKSFEILD